LTGIGSDGSAAAPQLIKTASAITQLCCNLCFDTSFSPFQSAKRILLSRQRKRPVKPDPF
jgi:hypothetical protein